MENITIGSPRLLLRTAETEYDTQSLFKYRNDPEYMDLCTNKKKILSYDEFLNEHRKEFTKSRHSQIMIELKEKPNVVIGTMFSYGLNLYDGYVFITVFLEKDYRRNGFAPESIVSFMSFLFKKFRLYKVYMDVYEYNKLSFHTLLKRGAVIEGVFREHHLHANKRYDLYRFAIYERDIDRIYRSVISMCEKFAPRHVAG